MKLDFATISILLAAFTPLLALIFALAIDRRNRKRIEKPPQEEKLLRPPGHSLAIRLDETLEGVLHDIFFACAITAFAGASAVAFARLLAAHISGLWLFLFASLLIAFSGVGVALVIRAFHRLRNAQNIRLGLRGEQAVAETLHEIADSGFRAFHDFPGGDDWNIDHVAVGARGVFLIETKARHRRGSRNGQPEHVVICEGETLRFPSGTDRDAIPQAKRNAKNLSAYLTKKTGEPVKVEPVVVVPGWFVQCAGEVQIKAMNAKYLAGYLRGKSELIEPAQVRRISAALDEKCRDVEF